MARRSDENEDREDPVVIKYGSDEDEDEANEDLSLKILEKALSRRELDDSKETTFSDIAGSGVVSTVMVNGPDSKSHKKKTKRSKNLEDAHEIPIVWRDQDDNVLKDVAVAVDEVEKSAEPKPGEASNNMVLKKLLRGARYFDPPESGFETCFSCGEQGHATINCPTPTTRKKPCFICGSLEHGAKQCTKGHDCYICKKSGHRARDCPDKYKSGSKSAVCLRCGDSGHDMILCKYEYSRDDLKDIQCYVCKSFGHLCCIEPGNSPSWAVSCYRCGQLGHIGLACGRYCEESTEKNSASSCFRCGEEGHFSRECPNSSSISTSHGRDSPSLCYRCNGAGHFARECPNSSQLSKRNREASTPASKSHKKFKETPEYNSTPYESNGKKTKKKESKDNDSTPHESNGKKKKKKSKENSEHYSTPHESNGKMKNKKKTHKGEQAHSTPQKSKQRGGWITEDPEEDSFQRGKIRRPRSPVTPSGHNHHTYMGGHNQRSPTFHSGGNFHGSSSTTPYGRNHRKSFDGHHSSHPPSRWQPHYPPSRHHQHYQNQRYAALAPSRYGSAHHYDEFQGDYGRW